MSLSFNIRPATLSDLLYIAELVRSTILEVYPRYYPAGAVEYFLSHHNNRAIAEDISAGRVFVAEGEELFGTVTVKENEICRLFVLPRYQRNGIGRALMDLAEERIAAGYPEARLAASFPAKRIYLRRGYRETDSHEITAENGDVLFYDEMSRTLK